MGEDIAARFLVGKGFSIITRNFRKPWGEIDIIAKRGEIYRFVEVKAVSCESSGNVSRVTQGYRPEEQAHPEKLRKVARTAELYMAEEGKGEEFQVDVVAVRLDFTRRIANCRLYENALAS